ncbi:MAG: TonB-dependent receptor [Verrucomicrobia bacterium]|nr:TonB-dependent receptor [Verrucomicrobiota bacterium]
MMSKKNRIALIERALSLTNGLSSAKAGKSRVFRNSVFVAGAFAASTTFAQTPAAAPAAEPVYELEALTTTGEGMSRATNTISAADVKLTVPGASIEKSLAQIPGINVTTRDPFGQYESANDVRVRSFGISQVAVNIDDVPMGSNGARFGLPAGRVTDGENLSQITVSQGAGDVTTPASEALGGAIKYYTTDPTKEAGLQVKGSFGDFDYSRQFVKVNTGEIVPGVAAWVSASDMKFKAIGVPEDSTVKKVESKVTYTKNKFKGMVSYTWNNRDDYDTSATRYDYYKVMDTGNVNALYPDAAYRGGLLGGGATNVTTILPKMAQYGFTDYNIGSTGANYTPGTNTTISGVTRNYSDKLRNNGPFAKTDATQNLGDGLNSGYYKWQKNGRQDNFFRGKGELDVTEDLKLTAVGYYHKRDYYGTFPVARSSIGAQIQDAYVQWKAQGNTGVRPDLYPTYAYKLGGALVPRGTPGATPVGWTELGATNGILDNGEALNYGSTPTEFSSTHAIVGKDSTTASIRSAIPGHTARYETIDGDRTGGVLKADYEMDNHTFTVGMWYEYDSYYATRPQFNLANGGFNGPFLMDQMLFNNYERQIDTTIMNAFVQDSMKFMDDKLGVTVGTKMLYGDRTTEGYLTTADWRALRNRTNDATYEDYFLPQASAVYKLSANYETFFSYAQSFAMPTTDVLVGLNNPGIDPAIAGEEAETFEFGVRYIGQTFGANISVFQTTYDNRVGTLSLTTEQQRERLVENAVGSSYFTNAGAIVAKGVEIGTEWKTPLEGLKVAASGSFLQSKFDDNIRVAYATWHDNRNTSLSAADRATLADYRAYYEASAEKVTTGSTAGNAIYSTAKIKGNQQINTPEFAGRLDLTYTWKNWSTTFGTEYRDAVFLNIFNTEEIPAYIKNNLNISWRGSKGSKLEPLGVSLSVSNLFDNYILYSTANGNSPVPAQEWGGSVAPDYGRTMILSVEARF